MAAHRRHVLARHCGCHELPCMAAHVNKLRICAWVCHSFRGPLQNSTSMCATAIAHPQGLFLCQQVLERSHSTRTNNMHDCKICNVHMRTHSGTGHTLVIHFVVRCKAQGVPLAGGRRSVEDHALLKNKTMDVVIW